MTDRRDRPGREEVAALLGMTLPDIVSMPPASGGEPTERVAVLVILVPDDERSFRRLRPLVHRVFAIAHDLTEREAFGVAEGLRP